MKISLIQDNIIWADSAANLSKLYVRLQQLSGRTDVVVLPEMFSTGFCVDKPELAENMNGEVVQCLKSWADEFQLAITGSLIINEKSGVYNRAFFIRPDGDVFFADKRHLFTPGGESRIFTKGNTKLKVNYKGVRFFVLICYDIRFPVWSRNVNNEYDVLVYVANFPANRISNWDILLKARAIENQCYVCGVNRVGVDGLGIAYNGHSVLLDYLGKPVVECDENAEMVVTGEVDIDKLKNFRERSPFWKDADEFSL